jgi:hypothetical protein
MEAVRGGRRLKGTVNAGPHCSIYKGPTVGACCRSFRRKELAVTAMHR